MRFIKPPGIGITGYGRRGVTLIELLVVVSMLIILVAVLTTAMQPVLAGKEIRESARQLNAYIAASIARAGQTGRPAGVWLERYPASPNAVFEVFFAEVPPLYAGDTTSSSATITGSTADLTSVSPLWGADGAVGGGDDIVNSGDLIKFNYVGPWYPISGVTAGSVTFTLGPTGDLPAPPTYPAGTTLPFQIRRQARKSPVEPLQMPANTVIDLANSGVGNGVYAQAFGTPATGAVGIMFSPEGSVEYVTFNGTTYRLVDTVYLLVGRPGDQLGANNLGTEPNENRWISINHQTGRVITSENSGLGANGIKDAREYATAGQGMGGS